ncbi:MAG: tetratricopeptide repeat protein [Verrucomicrobiia bacterium]
MRAVLIVLLTVVAYIPAIRGGFIWDDHYNIANNQLLRTWAGLKKTWTDTQASLQYYPLSYTGFWVEYNLWGTNPFGYHVVNVLLHALNAVLIGLVLSRMEVPGAWLAALLFAVHPVHVESVTWVTELKNVLSGFFFLSALLAFLRFHQRAEHRWWFYAFSLLLFVCALLSKTSTVALPLAIALVLWWKLERVKGRDLLPVLPFVVVGAALALLTVGLEKHHVGAEGSEWQLSLVERCLVAGRVVWFAAGKLLWPHPLMFIYPRWRVDATVWWQYFFPAATVGVLLTLWLLRERVGKGPLAATLFFVGTTAPVPAAFNLYFTRYSYMADHFYYLAGMGFMALASAVLCKLLPIRKLLLAAALPIVTAFFALSWQHCKAFKEEESLWRDTLAKNPNAWMAHNNLGLVLASQGKTAEAIAEYRASLEIDPDNVEAHYNLGNALASQGKVAEAIAEYRASLEINPDNVEAYNNLGLVLAGQGKTAEAIAEYQAALRIKPDLAPTHNNLANTLVRQGRLPEAVAEYRAALRIKPDDAATHNNLGLALARRGEVEEAIAEYRTALQIKPDYAEAHYNLGLALAEQGKTAEATTEYRETLRLRPDWPPALGGLAWILATSSNESVRNGGEAVQLAERLCAFTGYQQADAMMVLAAAYAEGGRFGDAVQVAQKALELARTNGQQELAAQAQWQLKLYQDGHPFRERSAAPPPP